MEHPNKNDILDLFFHEETSRQEKKISTHIQHCQSCQEYLTTLNQADQVLSQLPEEQPLPQSFDLILANISPIGIKPTPTRSIFSSKPILHITFALALILISIYFVQMKVSLLPIWQSLKQLWLIKAFGSFGIVTVLFFCIGTFITLSLTPILVFKTKQFNGAISR